MPRPLLVLLLCLGAALAGPGQTGLRKLWASTQYTPQPLPAVWTPATVAKGELTVESLRAAGIKETGLSIPKFIARHGLPGRYLTTRKAGEWDFLIYDLPSGHSVALYVPKPPHEQSGAYVVIARDGSLVALHK